MDKDNGLDAESMNEEEIQMEDGATAPRDETEPTEGSSSSAEENEVSDYAGRVKALEEENSELKDRLLRKQADYENFRKRINKDKEDSIKYANQMLLLDIADTIDNFERAIQSSEAAKDYDTFHDGIVMIEKQLVSMLDSKWNLKRYTAKGEPFDPEKHLAIAVDDSADVEVDTVVEDYQKGYMFHDRILRPAKVKVAKPAPAVESGETNNNEEN